MKGKCTSERQVNNWTPEPERGSDFILLTKEAGLPARFEVWKGQMVNFHMCRLLKPRRWQWKFLVHCHMRQFAKSTVFTTRIVYSSLYHFCSLNALRTNDSWQFLRVKQLVTLIIGQSVCHNTILGHILWNQLLIIWATSIQEKVFHEVTSKILAILPEHLPFLLEEERVSNITRHRHVLPCREFGSSAILSEAQTTIYVYITGRFLPSGH